MAKIFELHIYNCILFSGIDKFFMLSSEEIKKTK